MLPASNAAGVTEPLLADDRLRKVTFTGSTRVGKILIEQSARNVLRTSMELGGNAPFVVFDDADIDAAVDGAMAAKMRNGGEACTAANRIIVANSVREEFTVKLTERIAALTVGPGLRRRHERRPPGQREAASHVESLVDDAVAAGARVRTGGSVVDGPGWFYRPTVLDEVPAAHRASSARRSSVRCRHHRVRRRAGRYRRRERHGVRLGRVHLHPRSRPGTPGLGQDRLRHGRRQRGVVSDVAAPFGGVKQSGLGSEGGTEGIDEYLSTKYTLIPVS